MILVTGGTGLVGAHLLLYLVENDAKKLRAIYRSPEAIEKTKSLFKLYKKAELFSKIEWIQGDILDVPSLEKAFEKVDFVYHCAGLISFDPNDEESLRKINIEGTANIVNFCIDKNVKKLCHVSSIAALGNLTKNEELVTESTDWNPEVLHSDYAISKYGAEMEVWRGQQEGLQVIIVNPGVIFGPGFWNQGSGNIFNTIEKGISFYTNGTTGYVAVTDVVKIMHLLMNSDCNGERFTLVSENISYKDIVHKIASKINVKLPQIEAKPWLLNLIWKIDWFISIVFRTKRKISKHGVLSLQNKDLISNEKLKAYLNYTFEDIETYLNKIVVYYNSKN